MEEECSSNTNDIEPKEDELHLDDLLEDCGDEFDSLREEIEENSQNCCEDEKDQEHPYGNLIKDVLLIESDADSDDVKIVGVVPKVTKTRQFAALHDAEDNWPDRQVSEEIGDDEDNDYDWKRRRHRRRRSSNSSSSSTDSRSNYRIKREEENKTPQFDWSAVKQYDDDYNSEWFDNENRELAETYNCDCLKVRYNAVAKIAYFCDLCDVEMIHKQQLRQHLQGPKHQKKLNQKKSEEADDLYDVTVEDAASAKTDSWKEDQSRSVKTSESSLQGRLSGTTASSIPLTSLGQNKKAESNPIPVLSRGREPVTKSFAAPVSSGGVVPPLSGGAARLVLGGGFPKVIPVHLPTKATAIKPLMSISLNTNRIPSHSGPPPGPPQPTLYPQRISKHTPPDDSVSDPTSMTSVMRNFITRLSTTARPYKTSLPATASNPRVLTPILPVTSIASTGDTRMNQGASYTPAKPYDLGVPPPSVNATPKYESTGAARSYDFSVPPPSVTTTYESTSAARSYSLGVMPPSGTTNYESTSAARSYDLSVPPPSVTATYESASTARSFDLRFPPPPAISKSSHESMSVLEVSSTDQVTAKRPYNLSVPPPPILSVPDHELTSAVNVSNTNQVTTKRHFDMSFPPPPILSMPDPETRSAMNSNSTDQDTDAWDEVESQKSDTVSYKRGLLQIPEDSRDGEDSNSGRTSTADTTSITGKDINKSCIQIDYQHGGMPETIPLGESFREKKAWEGRNKVEGLSEGPMKDLLLLLAGVTVSDSEEAAMAADISRDLIRMLRDYSSVNGDKPEISELLLKIDVILSRVKSYTSDDYSQEPKSRDSVAYSHEDKSREFVDNIQAYKPRESSLEYGDHNYKTSVVNRLGPKLHEDYTASRYDDSRYGYSFKSFSGFGSQ